MVSRTYRHHKITIKEEAVNGLNIFLSYKRSRRGLNDKTADVFVLSDANVAVFKFRRPVSTFFKLNTYLALVF